MKKLIFLVLVTFVLLFSQDKNDVDVLNNFRNDIGYLSSETCFGRGIARDGIYKAENYLSHELEKLGLKVRKQNVKIRINVPQEDPVFVINDDTLRIGYDYIPHPFCNNVDKSFRADQVHLVKQAELELLKDSLDLISLSGAKRYLLKNANKNDREKLLIFEEEYPIVSRQSMQYPHAAFQLVKESIPDTIEHVYAKNNTRFIRTRTRNVLTLIPGSEMPDSVITLAAHYDHMGGFKSVYYPGANDNGSGIAVLLALARYYAYNPPPMTLVFCFFAGEEQGLYGSEKYVKHPLLSLKKNMMVINLDMIGSGHEGWGAVAGNEFPNEAAIFESIAEKNNFGKIKLRNNAKNSDHFPFTLARNKAIFFYSSGGKQPYHHPDDVLETMDIDVMERMFQMIKEYIKLKS